jgi:hypothetical protein
MLDRRGKIYDDLLQLQSLKNVATAQAGAIDGTAATIDLGEGYVDGMFVVDVTTIIKPVAGGGFGVQLQGALDGAFASWVPLANIFVGDNAAGSGFTELRTPDDHGTGRYTAPFHNDYGGTIYRYARAYIWVGGTISTGVTIRAFVSK